MNHSKKDIIQENEYLHKVLELVKKEMKDLNITITDRVDYIDEFKKYVWDSRAEMDNAELATNMQGINNEVGSTNRFIKRIQFLKKSLESPYFGRIDFIRKAEQKRMIYVGLTSIVEDYQYFVYDWRAPISNMFYDFEIGDAYYIVPKGKIEGVITLRRQYKIIKGYLSRFFDSEINIRDEYLQEVLAQATSTKLKNIVHSIQQEQNQIIRNVDDRVIIVQGVAGSGKTTVALHRIAYLLYKEKNIKSSNILIFSPNAIFTEYISDVLPDLGEENTLQTTFSDFAFTYLDRKIESFSSFLERGFNIPSDSSEFKNIQYKLSDKFKKRIDEYVLNIDRELYFKKGINVGDKDFNAQYLTELFHSRFSGFQIFDRLNVIAEYLCELSHSRGNRKIKQTRQLLFSSTSIDVNIESLYEDIINSDEEYSFSETLQTRQKIKIGKKIISYEDSLGLLYLKSKLLKIPQDKNIRHVVIDEAQDYTIIQLELLKKLFPDAYFTILGDKNQTINPFYRYSSLEDIRKVFINKWKYIELNKTYRSTEAIVNFTNIIIGINNVHAIRNLTSYPIIMKDVEKSCLINSIQHDLNDFKKDNINTIAIITKTAIEAKYIHDNISKIFDVILITTQTDKYSKKTTVLPAYMSKGLEFDGVIIYTDENNKFSDQEKFLYYVACTRALHKLIIYNQGL
ncbi:MAG: AAA family ATPase [Melioribacteraceae bacterium]|nr:AAA family ATPase [Melioribacteraceae bacterium]